MRVIVTGSRKMPLAHAWRVGNILWSLYEVASSLNHHTFEVIHGGCPMPDDPAAASVDAVAHLWVERAMDTELTKSPNVAESVHPADWSLGKAAGPIRNRQMAVNGADLCVAFLWEPGGTPSRGTRGMIKEAEDYGIPVWAVTLS